MVSYQDMKELQQRVKMFCKDHNMDLPIELRLLDSMSELGEVAKEILRMSNYGKQPLAYKDSLQSELWDVFYTLIAMANIYDIDLEHALDVVLKKYEKRLLKWSADSINE